MQHNPTLWKTVEPFLLTWVMPFVTGIFGVVATLLANHYYSKRKSKREEREKLFRTLMVTRGYRLSPAHVDALCAVEVEFSAKEQDNDVRRAWKHYRDHLDTPAPPHDDKAASDQYNADREDRFVGLLFEIGKAIGKEYSREELKSAYLPGLWYETEIENQLLRKGLLNVLNAGAAQGVIPVGVIYDSTLHTATPILSAPAAKAAEQGK